MTARFHDYFLGEQVGWQDGRAVWLQRRPLRFTSDVLGGRTIVALEEFYTDLASSPRAPLTWWIAGGRATRPAVIHDWPYQFGFWWVSDPGGGLVKLDVEKPLVDRVFWEAMRVDPIAGTGPKLAWLMYQAVRVAGRGRWRKTARATALNPIWSREWGISAASPG